MNAVFADTSYFLALLIKSDESHALAADWARKSKRNLVTSDYVITEVGNYLSKITMRHRFHPFLKDIKSSSRADVISASDELMRKGCDLYTQHMDKEWSLTDCISFEIMRIRGIRDVLTTDHHFKQAAFNIVLPNP